MRSRAISTSTSTFRVTIRPVVVEEDDADVQWSADGAALITATVSLQANTGQCVTFDVVLLRPMQAVSAEFECGYGHFVVTFNQPIRRSVEIMNFALARSSSPPQTALGQLEAHSRIALRLQSESASGLRAFAQKRWSPQWFYPTAPHRFQKVRSKIRLQL